MATKGKKAAPSGGKGKKAAGFGKGAGAGMANPLANFEDEDMYQEPIKKVLERLLTIPRVDYTAPYRRRTTCHDFCPNFDVM